MNDTSIAQASTQKNVFDKLPTFTDFACQLAAMRNESDESIAYTRSAFAAIESFNPFMTDGVVR
jgi:hypothetical protein